MNLLGPREPWLLVPEHMDRPDVSGPFLEKALDGLGTVHRHLGGRRCVERALSVLSQSGLPRRIRVLDVGCGGGELAAHLADWARRRSLTVSIVLADFNRHTCRRAHLRAEGQATVVQCDAAFLPFDAASFDMVHFGLFLHHFDQRRIADLLIQARRVCRVAVLVGDLHRHWLPLLFLRATAWLSGSAMIRHDGPLSIRRGFDRRDLERIGEQAQMPWSLLARVWPYRWLAVHRIL